MRPIDADALRASFKSEIGEHFCEFGGWCTVFRDASSVIDKAPTIDQKPQWIPVAERLPEDDTMMLVTCRTKRGLLNVNRAYYFGGAWHGSGSMAGVIAWMPMLEPYVPEKEENNEKNI